MNKMIFPLFAFLFFSKMLVAQVDTVPPVIVCEQDLTVHVGLCFSTVWASDLINTFSDDFTPLNEIEIGVRKPCTGNGFPEDKLSVIFSINEMGIWEVEVWARDNAGNTNSCSASVGVYDPDGSCDPSPTAVWVRTPAGLGIKDVMVDGGGFNCKGDTFSLSSYHILTQANGGTDHFDFIRIPGYNSQITPSKNINPLNGVTTYDLVLIQKHILGIELLDSPWKIIAADANQDGKVTTFDIITLRKLILGITTELPNGKSWRFAPKDYVFPNPANPFQPPFPERIEVPNTADPAPHHFQFTGVKIGDVDFSADPNQ